MICEKGNILKRFCIRHGQLTAVSLYAWNITPLYMKGSNISTLHGWMLRWRHGRKWSWDLNIAKTLWTEINHPMMIGHLQYDIPFLLHSCIIFFGEGNFVIIMMSIAFYISRWFCVIINNWQVKPMFQHFSHKAIYFKFLSDLSQFFVVELMCE